MYMYALQEELQQKVAVIDKLLDKIGTLRRKLEDVTKSSAMVDKMARVTGETIEELE